MKIKLLTYSSIFALASLALAQQPAALNTVIFKKGDPVPGVVTAPATATFTSYFGVPAINSDGKIAVIAKWSESTGTNTPVISYHTGLLVNNSLLVEVGDLIGAFQIKSMKDPVIDEAGRVAFVATFQIGLGGVTSANDSALISNANTANTLAIVAQEGTTAPDTGGAVWKSFQSLAAPGGGGGVLILGTLLQGSLSTPATTSANDTGVWSHDGATTLSIVLREGTTVIETAPAVPAVPAIPGVNQVETATAVGDITAGGNLSVRVTAAGVTGSPITTNVEVLTNDTAVVWAGKVRNALALNTNITTLYTVGGTSTAITLTRLSAAANDATLNIALSNGSAAGITEDLTSDNTTAGVAAVPAVPAVPAVTKIVKSFKVLKSVSGTPGQTHAFNNDRELVSQATFIDGTQAVVISDLP